MDKFSGGNVKTYRPESPCVLPAWEATAELHQTCCHLSLKTRWAFGLDAKCKGTGSKNRDSSLSNSSKALLSHASKGTAAWAQVPPSATSATQCLEPAGECDSVCNSNYGYIKGNPLGEYVGVIQVLYRLYRSCWDDGYIGNISGLYRGYIGIMENEMETTILGRGLVEEPKKKASSLRFIVPLKVDIRVIGVI